MKKLFYLLVLFIFLIPFKVNAVYTTDKFYFDIKINSDGSLFVRELALLQGDYNNRERTIQYRTDYFKKFTGIKSDFYESDIYNNGGITDVKVGGISSSNLTFDSIYDVSNFYTKTSSVVNGECGKYVLSEYSDSIYLRINCHSSYKRAFYIEYKVLNSVVVHNDVAELRYALLGDGYEENIEDFKVKVHLPDNDETMRFWAHGPLNGNIEKLDDKTVYLTSDFIGAYNPTDVRIMFDKNLVPYATKTTNVDAKDMILEIEEELADEANKEREQSKLIVNFVKGATVFWYLGLIGLLVYVYRKHDKELKPNYKYDYYREIPENYPPELVEYLMKKNVTGLGFKANILSLIERKKIKVEGSPGDKSNYRLTLVSREDINDLDNVIIQLLFEDIGNHTLTLKELEKYSKSISNAQNFMNKYNAWLNKARYNGQKANLFETRVGFKVLSILLVLVTGFLLFSLNVNIGIENILVFFMLPVIIFSVIYLIVFKKRTIKGVEDYNKWSAFKKFLLDFGHFSDKELPEIALWEKYLVYATVLGCAKQLEKSMKMKLQEMSTTVNNPTFMDYYILNSVLHSSISNSISSAVNTAVASSHASIAKSQSSSGGGFGGGFSSGGGFGGGFGGGGGRS
jgi:uncharacterized membrane protein